MKSDKYEPRVCEICGRMYTPGRIDQRTCASPECVRERKRAYGIKKKNEGVYKARKRAYMQRKREPEEHKPKPDTIIAIGYADRQREQTLKMVGKVKVEL